MKKFFLIFLLHFLAAYSFGQADSAKAEINTYTTFRAGLGFEKTTYLEFGLSRVTISDKGFSSGSWGYYASAQLGLANGHLNYGVKAGFESALMIFMWAAEAKYTTDNKNAKFCITPKAGLSLLGVVNVLYGYNLRIGNNDFTDIGRHQVSLTANLSKSILKEIR